MKGFFNKGLLVIASLIYLQFTVQAQDSKDDKKAAKEAEMQSLIQSKNFVFVAQYANPLGRRTLNLTSVYDLRLSKDTIIAELPYFGRAFVAPLNPAEGGINFTSTKFSYTVKDKKKGGWDVAIIPSDAGDVSQMFLTVTEDGYASLQVTSNNREAISFTGYVISKSKFK